MPLPVAEGQLATLRIGAHPRPGRLAEGIHAPGQHFANGGPAAGGGAVEKQMLENRHLERRQRFRLHREPMQVPGPQQQMEMALQPFLAARSSGEAPLDFLADQLVYLRERRAAPIIEAQQHPQRRLQLNGLPVPLDAVSNPHGALEFDHADP